MRLSSGIFALSLAVTVQCAAVPNSHALHERREVASSQWVKREKIPSLELLPMRIGLKQRNLDRGYDLLMHV
jgi:tripeptidyl-peptidase-1